jgi:phenylacetic acid degradation operon negative regulatory protein
VTEEKEWDGRWRLFNYSIPESRRKIREKLRKEMEWLGYGTLSSNMWIAPWDHMRQVKRLIRQYELEDHVQLFVADHVGPYSDEQLVHKCWDVEEMKALYQVFIDTFSARMQAVQKHGTLADNEAFVVKTELVHEYRKFLFLDPGLPDRLLEGDWTGRKAAKLFRDWYLELHEPAQRFYEMVCGVSANDRTIVHPFLQAESNERSKGAE